MERDLETRLEELAYAEEQCEDWPTKVYAVCQEFWKVLDGEDVVEEKTISDFVRLLTARDAFGLARMVIPELRAVSLPRGETISPTSPHPQKNRVLARIAHQYANFMGSSNDQVPQWSRMLWEQEKQKYIELEVYRGGLLLHGKKDLTDEERKEVQDKLAEDGHLEASGCV